MTLKGGITTESTPDIAPGRPRPISQDLRWVPVCTYKILPTRPVPLDTLHTTTRADVLAEAVSRTVLAKVQVGNGCEHYGVYVRWGL